MRHALPALTAAAILAGSASPALAQAAADTADVRCVMVLQAVARDPNQRDNAVRGVYFYLGKLATRGPISRVEPIMLAEGRKMNSAPVIQAELGRCGGELSARSGELQAANQKLAKQLGPPPAAAPAKK